MSKYLNFQSEEPGERLSPGLLLLPGDSMITLNKFNEDDDDGFFLGGFNEDGSFIGDYMDTDPETNRAVMNRLVGFQQLFSKKCWPLKVDEGGLKWGRKFWEGERCGVRDEGGGKKWDGEIWKEDKMDFLVDWRRGGGFKKRRRRRIYLENRRRRSEGELHSE